MHGKTKQPLAGAEESQPLVSSAGAGGEMQTYQIHTPAQSSLGQTVVMSSPVSMSSHTKSDDPTMKREIRLAKNR